MFEPKVTQRDLRHILKELDLINLRSDLTFYGSGISPSVTKNYRRDYSIRDEIHAVSKKLNMLMDYLNVEIESGDRIVKKKAVKKNATRRAR